MLVATQLAVLAVGSIASAVTVPRDVPTRAPTDDAVSFAANLAKSFNIGVAAASGHYDLTIPIIYGRPPAPISSGTADVSLALTNCQLSQPVVTKGNAFTCADTSCQKSFDFTITNTTTNANGQLISATTDGKLIFQASSSSAWTPGAVTSSTTVVSKSLVLAQGQTCVPTNVQYSVSCQAQFTGYTQSFPGPARVQCGFTAGSFPWGMNPQLSQYCAYSDPAFTFNVTMDLDQAGNGLPWSVQGCSTS